MHQSAKPVLDTQRLVDELGEAACLDLFGAYGVELEQHDTAATHTRHDLSFTGIIGFTGRGVSGTCMLGATEALMQSMPGGGQPRDWIAELSNQLAGRLKAKLIGLGVTVYITTPVVLRGTRIEPVPKNGTAPSVFRTVEGTVVLWIQVETSPDFTQSAPGEACVAEGEAILF